MVWSVQLSGQRPGPLLSTRSRDDAAGECGGRLDGFGFTLAADRQCATTATTTVRATRLLPSNAKRPVPRCSLQLLTATGRRIQSWPLSTHGYVTLLTSRGRTAGLNLPSGLL